MVAARPLFGSRRAADETAMHAQLTREVSVLGLGALSLGLLYFAHSIWWKRRGRRARLSEPKRDSATAV